MTNTEIIKNLYAALNRDDIPAIISLFDPEIIRIEPAEFPVVKTFRGHAEVEAHFIEGRSTWAEGSCEPEKILSSGDKVIAINHVRVRLKNSENWLEGNCADVYTFRQGKVIEMRTFWDVNEAIEWSGIKE